MNKSILIFTVFLNLITSEVRFIETFQGMIVYKTSYESKNPQITNNQLNSLMGTTHWYAIKNGNYKSVFNGQFIKLQMYINEENRSYSFTAKSDTLYYEDYSKNIDKALSFEIKRNQDTVMGIPCDLLIVNAEKSKSKIYFNSSYSVDPNLFKNHKYGNWYYIVSKIKAIPLKTVTENDQFIMTSVATEISPMKLEDKVFEIQNKDKVAPAFW